ncbi:MAG TPA: hypothetical protein VK502_00545 [Candidatus Saccharimonadales bacterium]|nr:hypothetical protein [Candidatus Saccharimonadales bacterium]
MNKFIFKSYEFDTISKKATFYYGFSDGADFKETIEFTSMKEYDEVLLDRALFLSFVLVGTSYYKAFPSSEVIFEKDKIDKWQADFFGRVYQEGLSQFAFENKLNRSSLAHFQASGDSRLTSQSYEGNGIIALQSGGKDSLLTATLLAEKKLPFSSWYTSSSSHYPVLLDTIGQSLHVSRRTIDKNGLAIAYEHGGLNGHVPVTYIVASFALIDAILNNANTLLLSIGHEGEEPHDWMGNLPVNHQWSKTWLAEKAIADYVHRYISEDINIGSPLRMYSELKIAELFVRHSWSQYGHIFSSCNRANYKQGNDNSELKWCGECPKCANSFILFAPFLPAAELKSLFNGQDLFAKVMLRDTFKGLLGVDGIMKPFECVGETDELRLAYHMAMERGDYESLSFEVPVSSFNYDYEYDAQEWARQMVR